MNDQNWIRSGRSGIRMGPAAAIMASLLLVLSGCAGTGGLSGRPAWVDGGAVSAYPKNKFVTGLGSGDTLEAARLSAKRELSNIFSSQLQSEVKLIEEETMVGERQQQSSGLLSEITIKTSIELQGAEVPLHWVDPKNGLVWGYAVLERNKECLRVREEGRSLATELDAYARETQRETNPLAAVRAAVNGTRVAVELDGLEARSRVLGMKCLDARSVSTGAIRSKAETGMRGVRFSVKAREVDRSGSTTGPLPQLRERIAETLTDMGFRLGASSGGQLIPVDAWMRFRRVERGTDWVEYRWEASAEVGSPVPGGDAIVAVSEEGAESHTEPSTARLRARQKGETELTRQLTRLLKAYLAEGDGA